MLPWGSGFWYLDPSHLHARCSSGMRHLHPHLPASCRSQAEASRAALTSRKIYAEIHSTSPGEKETSRGLGATLLVSLQCPTEALLLPRLLTLHPSLQHFLPNPLCHLASLISFLTAGLCCCPKFSLCSPGAPSLLLLFTFFQPMAWETALGTGCSPCSITHLERTISVWWRRDTPNDLCFQSPQVACTSLSSRLTAKFTFAKPLSSFYRFFDSLSVFLCYSGVIQLMASQHCHYKTELFRCLLLSFKNWLYAEIWQTKCQPRRKFYFLPILYSKKKWPHFGLHKNVAFAASMTLVK